MHSHTCSRRSSRPGQAVVTRAQVRQKIGEFKKIYRHEIAVERVRPDHDPHRFLVLNRSSAELDALLASLEGRA